MNALHPAQFDRDAAVKAALASVPADVPATKRTYEVYLHHTAAFNRYLRGRVSEALAGATLTSSRTTTEVCERPGRPTTTSVRVEHTFTLADPMLYSDNRDGFWAASMITIATAGDSLKLSAIVHPATTAGQPRLNSQPRSHDLGLEGDCWCHPGGRKP